MARSYLNKHAQISPKFQLQAVVIVTKITTTSSCKLLKQNEFKRKRYDAHLAAGKQLPVDFEGSSALAWPLNEQACRQ